VRPAADGTEQDLIGWPGPPMRCPAPAPPLSFCSLHWRGDRGRVRAGRSDR
jgi:hypothetical protein